MSRPGVSPLRQAIALPSRIAVGDGWRVVRSSEAALLERARASYATLPADVRARKTRMDVRLFGTAGAPLKADFSLVDMSHPYMQPAHEPVRSLIYSASDRAIRHVYVDGTQVVRDGKVLTVDVEAATAGLIEGQRKRLETVSQRDWAGRTADQLAPPVYGTKERLPQSRPVS